jgi:ABC-2 type transport system ATP-binding protein
MNKISVKSVVKTFGSKMAVRNVSFEVPEGRVFGLLGPNGAGKTTLIRMMIDIIKPDAGEILVDGHPMTLEDKDRITYLPEERGLYKKEKVGELLEYLAQLKGMTPRDARRRTASCLLRLEMPDAAAKKVEELSKGNQLKVQIASTLVSDPEVIILDEPFSGLDPLNVMLTKTIIREEKAVGKTVILSTHKMNQVEELCDSLMMINSGTVVLYGPVLDILARYSEPAFPAECRGMEIDSFRKASMPLEQIFVNVAREGIREAQE